MLGRTRRTTRTDVALAVTMAGIVYLGWALVGWLSRSVGQALAGSLAEAPGGAPAARAFASVFGGRGGYAYDLIGPVWMLAGLWLVLRASRQRRIISWSWLLITAQALAAILVAAWSCWSVWTLAAGGTPIEVLSGQYIVPNPVAGSPYVVIFAVVIWSGAVLRLLYDLASMRRRPTPASRDGLKTHAVRN